MKIGLNLSNIPPPEVEFQRVQTTGSPSSEPKGFQEFQPKDPSRASTQPPENLTPKGNLHEGPNNGGCTEIFECWWFFPKPFEKICAKVKLDHLPTNRGGNKKLIETIPKHPNTC